MTSREKKAAVLREVVKPELKTAGFRLKNGFYHSPRGDCNLGIVLSSSQWNDVVNGFSFWFDIKVYRGELEQRWSYFDGNPGITESVLLPDCGYLHPFHSGVNGWKIDGYKNYAPQDMDVEEVKSRIRDDLRLHIFPQLAGVTCRDDWPRLRAEWFARLEVPRVLLLRYYSLAQMHAPTYSQIIPMIRLRRQFGLSADEIRANRPLYDQIRAWSALPASDHWPLILAALQAEERGDDLAPLATNDYMI